MYGLASRLGENMPGWRGITGGGGVGEGKKKNQGPQSQEFPVDWERGAKQKGRFVPAVLPQGREWIKRCFSAWAFVF